MKKLFILYIILSCSIFGKADDDFKITGLSSVAVNSKNIFLNFGGPSLKFEKNDYYMSFSFFPSLRYDEEAHQYSPVLGAGLLLGRESVFIVLPNYYYTANWYTAFGLGYRF
jgi:hypothetical protein